MSEDKKEITIVNGDGKDLTISPVYDHIKTDKEPNDNKKKKDIVIPKGKDNKK